MINLYFFVTSLRVIIRKMALVAKLPIYLQGTLFPKYPIFFSSLISRINALSKLLDGLVQSTVIVYPMTPAGKLECQKDLKNQGGIYIWFCHVTGLFYVGSAKSFWCGSNRSS